MKRHLVFALTLTTVLTTALLAFAADDEDGFKSLTDGKTFDGWKPSTDSPDTWKIEDGDLSRTAKPTICITSVIPCRSRISSCAWT